MTDKKSEIAEERKALFDRMYAFHELKLLAMAVEWDLVQRLATEPKSIAQLAADAALPERSVNLIVQALVGMRVLHQVGSTFAPTDKGRRFMLASSDEGMRDFVRVAESQFDALVNLRKTMAEEAILWSGPSSPAVALKLREAARATLDVPLDRNDVVTFIDELGRKSREDAVALLRKAASALPSGGHVVIAEEHGVGDDRRLPPNDAWVPIYMVMSSHGELRTPREWIQICTEAGLGGARTFLPSGPGGVALIHARKS